MHIKTYHHATGAGIDIKVFHIRSMDGENIAMGFSDRRLSVIHAKKHRISDGQGHGPGQLRQFVRGNNVWRHQVN